MTDKLPYILALNAHPKIGGQTIKKVLAVFSDPKHLWSAIEGEIRSSLEPRVAELVLSARKTYSPEGEQEKIKRLDLGCVTIDDKQYPSLLAEIPDAPAILYIKGDASAIKKPGIAIVGSRKFTSYGKWVAKKFSTECADNGIVVVSGLALGIDGEAHRAVLDAGGVTIGVLACGLDRIYPSSHIELAREIIERGGAIVSEYSPGTEAFKQNFPARNRIIAGLTLGTLVVEAGEGSGSLITAGCALDYNREVFAVPGGIDSHSSVGTNVLIQKGAKLVMTIYDILDELPIKLKRTEEKARETIPQSEDEQKIMSVLEGGEMLVDTIIKESQLNVISVNCALTMMEMKGMIQNIGGGRYRKIA
ncbi:MAG: DNA-processing protein DprA [Patescibacteria group bacterium]|jgi:DNA processing protein